MKTKNSTLYSILHQNCPRCHEGSMFKNAPYSSRFMEMNHNCPVCNLDFIQEPSFYFGAMYFSYAIQVVIFAVTYLLLRYTLNPDTRTYVIWMITATIFVLPLNYRWSRVMWISLFVSRRELK